MKNKEHTNELSKLAPRLQALRKQIPPVEAPAGYYERMTEEVMQKITAPQEVKLRSIRSRKWLSLAAALALSLIAAWWLFSKEQPASTMAELDWDAVSTAEVQDYVLHNIDEFELDWIIQTQEADLTPDYDVPADAIRNYLEEEWEEDALDELEDLF